MVLDIKSFLFQVTLFLITVGGESALWFQIGQIKELHVLDALGYVLSTRQSGLDMLDEFFFNSFKWAGLASVSSMRSKPVVSGTVVVLVFPSPVVSVAIVSIVSVVVVVVSV